VVQNGCTFTLELPPDAPQALRQTPLTVVVGCPGLTAASRVTCEPKDGVVSVESRSDSVAVTLLPARCERTVTWPKP
jgi:hypothetical protein